MKKIEFNWGQYSEHCPIYYNSYRVSCYPITKHTKVKDLIIDMEYKGKVNTYKIERIEFDIYMN